MKKLILTSLCLSTLFSYTVNAATELTLPLELKIHVSILAGDAQSMRELTFDNIELFRNSKVGVTHISNDINKENESNFNLIYVTQAESSTPKSPVYDVAYTFVSNTYNGTNEALDYYATGAPHNLLIPKTTDSRVITYKVNGVKVGVPSSKSQKSEKGDSRISLQLQ
ncbi:hypothetical protein [Pseudoalteromonas undina]|uniref:Orphan protein n=1 Tax=Pseudoalteromonas undina TaxID=43660 RepID=A0ABN0NL17_9GAMM|nr:hypothetical protein [Pseudoalteromonas undina]